MINHNVQKKSESVLFGVFDEINPFLSGIKVISQQIRDQSYLYMDGVEKYFIDEKLYFDHVNKRCVECENYDDKF